LPEIDSSSNWADEDDDEEKKKGDEIPVLI
jgi:hypothetical protein